MTWAEDHIGHVLFFVPHYVILCKHSPRNVHGVFGKTSYPFT
jgi:hypothetical protein